MDLENINNIEKKFNKICTLLRILGKNVTKTKTITKEIYNEVILLKYEKYCNIVHKDDLNFQVSSYYNTFIYHRKLLNIKKNKIFNDLLIFHNLLVYIITYANNNYKSKKKKYESAVHSDLDKMSNQDYKIESMEYILNLIIKNYSILNKNIDTMRDLCNELKPDRLLLISNIHSTFEDNIKSIEDRGNNSINKLLITLNYHQSQLEFYNNNITLEINTLINGGHAANPNLDVIISLNKDPPFETNDTIKILFKFNRIIQEKFYPSLQLKGANFLETTQLIKISNTEFFFDYIIKNGEGFVYINLFNIIDIYGNNEISIKGKDKFEIKKGDIESNINISFINNTNIFGPNQKNEFIATFNANSIKAPFFIVKEKSYSMEKLSDLQYKGEFITPDNENEELKSYLLKVTNGLETIEQIFYVDNLKPDIEIHILNKEDKYQKDDKIIFMFVSSKLLKVNPTIEILENDLTFTDTLIEYEECKYQYHYKVKSDELVMNDELLTLKISDITDLYGNINNFDFIF